MRNFPLKFKTDVNPADSDLTVLDAQKNKIFYRPKITEDMKAGKVPCVLFDEKKSVQPLYTILYRFNDDADSYVIKSAVGDVLGELLAGEKHNWKVMDAKGSLVATIQEKATYRNSCLFQILTFPMDATTEDMLMKMFAPYRYRVMMDGRLILELRELLTSLSEQYGLKKRGDFPEQHETLLLVSLVTVLGLRE